MVRLETQNRGAFLKMLTDAVALDDGIKRTIREIAQEYNRIVAAELSRPKSGILYGVRRGVARFRVVRRRVELFGGVRRTVTRRERLKSTTVRSWRASRPGEAPAVFTGNLRRGLRIAFPTRERGYGAKVFSRRGLAGHRHLLEFGTTERIQRTQNGKVVNRRVGRVLPRPLWTPMQNRALDDLERRILRVIDASAAFRGI